VFRLPEIRPVSDLARDARSIIERLRQRQEPVIITQRGRDVAILLPIDLYRSLENRLMPRLTSPHLVHSEGADKFRMQMSIGEPPSESPDAPDGPGLTWSA